jgi:hypothetical protein
LFSSVIVKEARFNKVLYNLLVNKHGGGMYQHLANEIFKALK